MEVENGLIEENGLLWAELVSCLYDLIRHTLAYVA